MVFVEVAGHAFGVFGLDGGAAVERHFVVFGAAGEENVDFAGFLEWKDNAIDGHAEVVEILLDFDDEIFDAGADVVAGVFVDDLDGGLGVGGFGLDFLGVANHVDDAVGDPGEEGEGGEDEEGGEDGFADFAAFTGG